MSKIWLINPPMQSEEIFARGSGATASRIPPLGLAYIAAYVRRQGHSCEILDGVASPRPLEEICRRACEFDLIGITVVTAYFLRVKELLAKLRNTPGCPTLIAGGPHVTALPESVIAAGADIAVIGEGEETMGELADLTHGNLLQKKLRNIAGIVFKDCQGAIVQTPRRVLISDLDTIPLPARDLLPMELYGGSVARSSNTPSHSLMTSRGCPGMCTFCSHMTFGNHVRYHSPARIVEEFFLLRDHYGANDIQIWDDNFVSNHAVVEAVCRELVKNRFGKTFSVEARADSITPDILKWLRSAGCDYIAFGIESGSQRILDLIQKKETLDQIRKGVRWAREAKLKIRGYFILGFPTETEDEMTATVRFAKELDIDIASFTLLVPFPGTAIWFQSQKSGTFDPDYFHKRILPEINFVDSPIYCPAGIPSQKLLHIHAKAYNSYYFRPKFILNKLASIQSPAELLGLIKGGYTLLCNALGTMSGKK